MSATDAILAELRSLRERQDQMEANMLGAGGPPSLPIPGPVPPTQAPSTLFQQQPAPPTATLFQQPPAASTASHSHLMTVARPLQEKIARGEFIDLSLLLQGSVTEPPTLQLQLDSNHQVQVVNKSTLGPEHVKRHVHDLSTWLEAFTKFINIASQIAPHRLSELLTYQATIITANNQFYPEAWLAYDLNFRSNAAADPTRRWDVVDTNLWQMSFTGKARPSCPACRLTHPATGGRCPFRPSKAITDQPARQQNSQRTICRNFNHGRCTYPNCRHAHICSACYSDEHAYFKCKSKKSAASKSK